MELAQPASGHADPVIALALVVAWTLPLLAQEQRMNPEAVLADTADRADAYFRADSGELLVRAEKQKPLAPGRGNYVQGYSYFMVGFAAPVSRIR